MADPQKSNECKLYSTNPRDSSTCLSRMCEIVNTCGTYASLVRQRQERLRKDYTPQGIAPLSPGLHVA